jgi:Uncharacterised protein family (UPF0104).
MALGILTWLFLIWKGIPMVKSIFNTTHQSWLTIHPVAILFALILMPINWCLEAAKWYILVKKDLTAGFQQAFNSVISGLTLSLLTPNRLGEPFTRSMLLKSENYVITTSAAVLCSLSQQLITIIAGITGILYLLSHHQAFPSSQPSRQILAISTLTAISVIIIILLIPAMVKKIVMLPIMKRVKQSISSLPLFGIYTTVKITGLSLTRYAVFTSQYLLLIYGVGANVSISIGLATIATIFLIASTIPSLFFIDIGIRVSLAIIFLGPIIGDGWAAIVSSMIWLINIGIPASYGSVILLLKPAKK